MTDKDWAKAGMPCDNKVLRPKDSPDVARGEPPDFKWVDGNGTPGVRMEPFPKTEEQVAATVANLLTAPERGVDMVNLPPHYARFVIEPIRFICENKLDFFQGNVVKYILRHDAKNGLEDIDKVIRYATMYKRFLQKDPDWWQVAKPGDLPNGS